MTKSKLLITGGCSFSSPRGIKVSTSLLTKKL